MKSNSKYTYNIIGFSIFIFLIIRNYLPIPLNYLNENNNTLITLLITGLTLVLSCILPIIAIERLIKFTPVVFKKVKTKKILSYIFFSQILFLLISLINQIGLYIFSYFSNTPIKEQTLLNIPNFLTFIIYYITIAVLPSIFEELFIRMYLLGILSKYGKLSSIIISSLFFSLMHLNIEQIFPAFLSSIILSYLYLKTNNILVSIGAHLINNSYSFLMLYISQFHFGVSSTFALVFINFVVLILGVSSFYSLKPIKSSFSFKEFINKEDDMQNFINTFSSPVLLLSLISCIYSILFIFSLRI